MPSAPRSTLTPAPRPKKCTPTTTGRRNHNKEIMTSFDTEELIQELLESLLHRYHVGLEQPVKGNEFGFDYVDGLKHHKCHK